MQRRNTKQRAMILETVRAHSDHPTADEIYHDVHERNPKVSRGTVYRNLNLLEEFGDIISIETPGGNRFDRRCDPHAHVICTKCSAVVDAMVDYNNNIDAAVEAETGFTIETHATLFYGLCPTCQMAKTSTEL